MTMAVKPLHDLRYIGTLYRAFHYTGTLYIALNPYTIGGTLLMHGYTIEVGIYVGQLEFSRVHSGFTNLANCR